ncbi:carbohydrate ABC transporter permease [Paenibacillus sp. WQ 127069]|uniref:Carbohydrate ABC transporter permease n=1 Tax=Paenibacillus baimaensis TaxID=2982185 RepID=A0ABT2UC67_9BACL|nr:carbohydrate ABC transporter permease [Paenibacillus sp. WQ 127069]MCU6792230.1 carbohydrate ABC transporter permease [Paenibacillus sp. WQ 127069]
MTGTKTGGAYNVLIYTVLILFGLITFIPFYYVLVASLSNPDLISDGELMLLPRGFTLEAYKTLVLNDKFLSAFYVTVARTTLGTLVNLIFQCSFAYALSKKYLPGRKFFMLFIIVTMMFNGGIIPTYLIVKATGLIDTIWALIIPGAISTWNIILLRSFFENVPESLEESARMDGANDIYILITIILPLSMPVIATIALFSAVGHWNSFLDAVIYTNSPNLQVLQIFLRNMVVQLQNIMANGDAVAMNKGVSSLTLRSAAIFASSLPIIMVYPFIQKHFMKGVMLGAVKG